MFCQSATHFARGWMVLLCIFHIYFFCWFVMSALVHHKYVTYSGALRTGSMKMRTTEVSRKFDLVVRKWQLFRTVTLSLSEWFGWELPTVPWYVGSTVNYTMGRSVTVWEHYVWCWRKWVLCCTTCMSFTVVTDSVTTSQLPELGSLF